MDPSSQPPERIELFRGHNVAPPGLGGDALEDTLRVAETASPEELRALLRTLAETCRHLEAERFLGRAGEILSASLDYRETVQKLAELCAGSLAQYCLVHVEHGGEIRALGVASSGPVPEAVVRESLPLLPVEPLSDHPVARALRSGESQLVRKVSLDRLVSGSPDGGPLQLLRESGVASVLVVPLRASGRTLGAITLARTETAPPYVPEDLALVEALASRVVHAVDNARLYREAREAVRAREETMSVVSHDLRNSLHATLLNVDLLLDVAPAFSPDSAPWRRMVAVRRSLQHMHRLVQDLLEVDRIGRGHLQVRPERLEPDRLAMEVTEIFGPLARDAGIELEVRFDDAVPPILADPARLVQVLSNLVSNALHATPRGGRVEVVVEPDSAAAVRVRVSDTGAGISEEELRRVFDRFYQGAGARRTGIGLGLTIARGIVEAHGGQIWAESLPGRGSTFSFTLPRADG